MRVLVSGATGFIGRHLVAELRARGHDVLSPGLDSRRLDLTDRAAVRAWFGANRPEALVHAAWYNGDDRLDSDHNEAWVDVTRDLLTEFGSHGGRRVVTVGTCFEYELESTPLVEHETPLVAHTPYGRAKAAVGELVAALDVNGIVEGAHARVGYVFGPGEEPPRLVPSLIDSLAAGHVFPATEGRQRRDYLFVADAAAALASILESDIHGPVNVGSGRAIPVADLIAAIADEMGAGELVDFGALPLRAGDPDIVELSVCLLHGLGWEPGVSLEEGVRRTVRFRQRGST